jgi:LPS sulfotransferase NodH
MSKKIVIITTSRTGSTYYCSHLAKKYNIFDLQEFFGPFEPNFKDNTIDTLKQIPGWVLKIFSGHLHKQSNTFLMELLEISTEHVFLYRKNFIEQARSWVLCENAQIFSPERHNISSTVSDLQILDARRIIYDEYLDIKKIYKKYPSNIIAYEDFATSDKKYPDYKSVQGNFNIIEDFDVLKEVFGK